MLSTSRLVTLTGIGGVGKTRLALRAAAEAQRNFSDGVTLVELADLLNDSLLAGVVAAALGLRDQSARPSHEVLVEFLAPREVLLVLDNCEQVVAAAAKLAEILLRVCPRLRILATSREPLGIGGETALLIPPLPARWIPTTCRRTAPQRCGHSVRGTRRRRSPGIRADRGEQGHHRPNLSAAGRAAATDRTGGGPASRDDARPDPAAPHRPLPTAHSRQQGRALAAADVADVHRLEL